MDYCSKVAIVTGACSGLGKAIANALLQKGAKVGLADVNHIAGKQLVQSFDSEYLNKVTFLECDVSDDKSFAAAFDFCDEKLGNVNLLVNNAGIGCETDWKKTMSVNLFGVIRGTELALERMSMDKGNNGGNVVNISSLSGVLQFPIAPIYATSKTAIIQYSRNVGAQVPFFPLQHQFHLKHTGVQVQSLCPSFLDTPFLRTNSRETYKPYCKKEFMNLMQALPIVSTAKVLDAFFQLIEEKPGATLVVEESKDPYYVDGLISHPDVKT